MTSKIIRWPDVKARVALSRTTVWRMVRNGKFPAPVQLTEHATGWRESDIDAWLASRQPAAAA